MIVIKKVGLQREDLNGTCSSHDIEIDVDKILCKGGRAFLERVILHELAHAFLHFNECYYDFYIVASEEDEEFISEFEAEYVASMCSGYTSTEYIPMNMDLYLYLLKQIGVKRGDEVNNAIKTILQYDIYNIIDKLIKTGEVIL